MGCERGEREEHGTGKQKEIAKQDEQQWRDGGCTWDLIEGSNILEDHWTR